MKIVAKLGIGLCLTAALGLAMTTYRGQLMDASCYSQNSSSGEKIWVQCAPTETTTSFAIHTNGKVRLLDPAGNEKALSALKGEILKRDKNTDMPVVIDGWRHGNTIKVEGIRARGSDTSVH
jgi:hypothetical protein